MISNDIKNLLTIFFLELAKHERAIESYRQVLSESPDFDAHQIFDLLTTNKNNINPKDIIKYLLSNNISVTDEEVNLIVLFYDKNLDGKLSYDEFINLVRSEKSSINNKSFNDSDNNKLSFSIIFSLNKLLEKEINISKSLIKILKDFKNKYGFNIHDIYHSIKSTNFITAESIKTFLKNQSELYLLDSDINLIMKRLDINRDGIVDLCEFHALLGFPNCSFSCLCTKCNTCGESYCDNCYIESHGCVPYEYKYPYQYNNNSNKNQNNKIGQKENITRIEQNTILKQKKREFNTDEDVSKNISEILKFNGYLTFLLEGENKIELMKIELCKNKDFNVEDAFRLFEKNGRGFLDEEDLKYGFGVLGVYPSDYNMKLFMKRYDLQKKGYISYADFYDIVVPFEKIYRDDIDKRIPKTKCNEITLGREINNGLNKLFKTLNDFENRSNIERKLLSNNNTVVEIIFNLFDNNNQGRFYFQNFINYLNNYGLLNNENLNPDLLYIRFDKKRNGGIDFVEFVDELEPL